MKKLSFLIAPILILVFNANAQTQKGDQNLGLGFNFNTSSGNYADVMPIEIGLHLPIFRPVPPIAILLLIMWI